MGIRVQGEGSTGDALFPVTSWTMLTRVRAGGPASEVALAELCRRYWKPLYVYVRYRGHNREDAEDLTQGFFQSLIARNLFGRADAERGKLRTFLLTALQNFLHERARSGAAWKRGGRQSFVSLDAEDCEAALLADTGTESPESAYDRHWAIDVIGKALAIMEQEYAVRSAVEQFDALKAYLMPEAAMPDPVETANILGMSEGALRVAIHRLRGRFRAVIRAEVAVTLADESDAEDEMRHLVAALRRESR